MKRKKRNVDLLFELIKFIWQMFEKEKCYRMKIGIHPLVELSWNGNVCTHLDAI